MSKITARKVAWVSSHFRPVAMPSVRCPDVKDWDNGQRITAMMGINHCLPCAYAYNIKLDMKAESGEVHCAAS